ncbi:MFS transporter [Tersicoccus sp. MR15.9]|uniref:MFS transporter n=1 Tax=Tersicoccus mangrovi TaxID=3121635 RepID=UPI002FE5374E
MTTDRHAGAGAPDGRAPVAVSPLARPHRALTIGLLAIVACFAFEAMAVTTAMPVVSADLGGGGAYGLAFSVYLTASLAATSLAGSWCDRSGPRPAMLVGLGLMTVGLLTCTLAGNFVVLVLGRAVSGAGGGLMIVAVYVLIGVSLPQDVQPQLFGWMSAAWVLPSLIGPLAAGLLAQVGAWRVVFVGVVPVVVVAVLAIRRQLRGAGAPAAPELTGAASRRRLIAGLVLAAAVLLAQTALTSAVGSANDSVGTAGPLLPAALTVAAVVVSALCLRRLMPAGFFRFGAGLPAVMWARLGLSVAFFGAEAFLPLMLTSVQAAPPAVAGLTLTTGAVGWTTGAFWQARTRVPPHRLIALAAALLAAAMSAMAAVVTGPEGLWAAMIVWAVAGFGMGVGTSVAGVLTLRYSTDADRGVNASSMQLADQLGGVVGTAGAGALFGVATAHLADVRTDVAGVYVLMWVAFAVLALVALAAGLRTGLRAD